MTHHLRHRLWVNTTHWVRDRLLWWWWRTSVFSVCLQTVLPCLKYTLLAMNDMPSCTSKQGWRTWSRTIMPAPSSCSTGRTYGLGAVAATSEKLAKTSRRASTSPICRTVAAYPAVECYQPQDHKMIKYITMRSKNTLTYRKLKVLTAVLWWFRYLGYDTVWLGSGCWSLMFQRLRVSPSSRVKSS